MAKKTTQKSNTNKVSYHKRPTDMPLEEWQARLRRQFAESNPFGIEYLGGHTIFGDYLVHNPESKNSYKVAFRGLNSEWNYCSCMDFKTNHLGTCKHIEFVAYHLKNSPKKSSRLEEEFTPTYSSVYLKYGIKREVKIRIGSENFEEYKALAEKYFDSGNVLLPNAYADIESFLHKARTINNEFRCYDDALTYIINERDFAYRKEILEQRYPDGNVADLLNVNLFPYQQEGILFATRAGRSIIADDMGLGKTIQAIGSSELFRKEQNIGSVMIICPTSLKYQWEAEIKKFTNSTVRVIEGNQLKRKEQYRGDEFYKIVSYHTVVNDIKYINENAFDLIILDEAQRIKNWKTKISQGVKKLQSTYSIVLTGTPLENKLEELYSIVQFVDPYLLGPYHSFLHKYQITDETNKVLGYQNLNEIGEILSKSLIRRRKKEVLKQLPARMDKVLFVPMTDEQKDLHEDFQFNVSRLVNKWRKFGFLNEADRKKLILFLSQMRMVCDSTFILDQKSRFDTKIDELMNILREVFDAGEEKVVVFSQWERMTRLVTQELDKLEIGYEYLHGGVPSEKRKELFTNFNNDPDSRVFVSTDAGSTGLNLQSASILINLDIPWNPALLEQRIARIYRLGQERKVSIINFVSKGTIEERMLDVLKFKSNMFEGVLDNGEDSVFVENSKFNKLMETVEDLTVSTEEETQKESQSISQDEIEEKSDIKTDETLGKTDALEEEFNEIEEAQEIPETKTTEPEQLISNGINFLTGLAQTLSSPEATQKLVSSLVEKDKESGKSYLKIPVENQEIIAQALNVFGQLFAAFNQKK